MRSLSSRLLVLTIAFVMLSEVLIYAPSIARFRKAWLEDRLDAAHLAILALEATPDGMVDKNLQARLLSHAGVLGIDLYRSDGTVQMLGPEMPASIDATYDLRQATVVDLVRDAFVTLARGGERVLLARGLSKRENNPLIEAILAEAPLRAEMIAYSQRILALSLFISVLTAGLLYFALHRLLVRPLRRLAASMAAFREAPEDGARVIVPSRRADEVGMAEKALAAMQEEVRAALTQKAHLAALGAAVGRIQHDLKGILSSAMVVSDSLEASGDPQVRRAAPTVVGAIERAVALCNRSLAFLRAGPPPVEKTRFALAPLVDEVTGAIGRVEWRNSVPAGLLVEADRGLLYRVLDNLCRNAVEAGARTVTVEAGTAGEHVEIRLADDGPGIAARARERLFLPFAGSARAGGSGLGLAIARELMTAQGGDVRLERTGPDGTVFLLLLPA